jgi:hypothetical protein
MSKFSQEAALWLTNTLELAVILLPISFCEKVSPCRASSCTVICWSTFVWWRRPAFFWFVGGQLSDSAELRKHLGAVGIERLYVLEHVLDLGISHVIKYLLPLQIAHQV